MKLRVLSVIFVVGILISVSYVKAQKTDSTIDANENSNEITEVTEGEQKLSDTVDSNSTGSQENEIQNSNQTETEIQVQNGKIVINGVSHIQQLPELARGCEVTSLAMLLQYAGVSVDKMTLANEIKTIPFRDQNGLRGNPNEGFVGDIYTFENSGYGVYHGPIADLAETYLPGRIVDLSGGSIESVYNMLEEGSPVWVITNSRFAQLPESEFATWNTQSGEVQITYREHSVLVVGYDDQNVYLNDPLADQSYTSVPRDSFEASWVQMGSQAVSYQK
ncbi:C39 family peptidase [Bacillus sp. T3]|uniref:C39 family peptidase n=1 Tax=Bacillus sp. T3 TaxID=467262 RepID=UPI0029811335|nr:C39 family peptidase [Bacillus sp. T3]